MLPPVAAIRNSPVASAGDPGDARVERDVTVPAPVDRVWSALTRSDELSEWFGAEVDMELRPGGRVSVRRPDGTLRPGVVEEVRDRRRLSFRWLPFERAPGGAIRFLGPGRVEFRLQEVAAGTRLRVTEWLPAVSTGGEASRAWSPAAPEPA
jgi:uncharacterized protein YndB with AHSA1/START domain